MGRNTPRNTKKSPGLGLGRVRSSTMCFQYLSVTVFLNKFSEILQWIQNQTTYSGKDKLEKLFLKLLLALLFLLEKRACEGGCQGALRKWQYMPLFTEADIFSTCFSNCTVPPCLTGHCHICAELMAFTVFWTIVKNGPPVDPKPDSVYFHWLSA